MKLSMKRLMRWKKDVEVDDVDVDDALVDGVEVRLTMSRYLKMKLM